jgi:hypothetical protein
MIMNKHFILFFLLILPFIALSQQSQTVPLSSSTKGVYLDISAGLSQPLGDYAGSDAGSDRSGFSRSGLLAQVACEWMGKKDFGVAVQYAFQLNPMKKTARDLVLPTMTDSLGSGDWANHYLMVGPVYVKYFKKILFEAKILIGVIISSSPLFKTEDQELKAVSNNTGTGLAGGVGAGAGYRVSSTVTLKLNAEYLFGTPKIHRQYGGQVVGDTLGALVYSPTNNFDTKKVVSSFNLGLSVIIKISH